MINFHGSTGFGQNFTDSISGNWGGYPFEDIMIGTKFLLSIFPWIDGEHVSACGASYGGYMINWLLGNAPGYFSAFVLHDGMFDSIVSYYITDELWFPEFEFKGTPWAHQDNTYEKWNPSNSDKLLQWNTPTLIIHGGKDYRLEVSQGLSTFTALQRLGITSELLYFPLENHWILNPRNGIKWYHSVIGWLDRFNKQ